MNKVVLITGAARDLGAHYAELFAKNDYTVVISARESTCTQAQGLAEKINSAGGKAFSFKLDMTQFTEFDEKIDEIIQKTGKIDVLINNAAISYDKSFFEVTQKDWDVHMETNLKGLFFLSQSVARKMKSQKSGGNIINIAAINGERIRKNCIPFGTSKAGVIHLTKAMAYELIEYNIRVNAISLGLFESNSVKEYIDNDPTSQSYLDQIPLKRAGKLEELEGPLLFLASEASSYMNGSTLHVDGGFAINTFIN